MKACSCQGRAWQRPLAAQLWAHAWKVSMPAAASYTGLASCSSADALEAYITATGSPSQRPMRATIVDPAVPLAKEPAQSMQTSIDLLPARRAKGWYIALH